MTVLAESRLLCHSQGNSNVRQIDQVIQHAREVRQKQIQECSSSSAQKILAQLSKGSKPTADTLTKLIAAEFDELSA